MSTTPTRYKVEHVIGDGYEYWRVIDTHDGLSVRRSKSERGARRTAATLNAAIPPAAVVTTYREMCWCPGDAIEARGGLTADGRCPICGTQWKEGDENA